MVKIHPVEAEIFVSWLGSCRIVAIPQLRAKACHRGPPKPPQQMVTAVFDLYHRGEMKRRRPRPPKCQGTLRGRLQIKIGCIETLPISSKTRKDCGHPNASPPNQLTERLDTHQHRHGAKGATVRGSPPSRGNSEDWDHRLEANPSPQSTTRDGVGLSK